MKNDRKAHWMKFYTWCLNINWWNLKISETEGFKWPTQILNEKEKSKSVWIENLISIKCFHNLCTVRCFLLSSYDPHRNVLIHWIIFNEYSIEQKIFHFWLSQQVGWFCRIALKFEPKFRQVPEEPFTTQANLVESTTVIIYTVFVKKIES